MLIKYLPICFIYVSCLYTDAEYEIILQNYQIIPIDQCTSVLAGRFWKTIKQRVPGMMIVYLHVIEDKFRYPSTRAIDYITCSMLTIVWFVSAYQEHHTILKSIIFYL